MLQLVGGSELKPFACSQKFVLVFYSYSFRTIKHPSYTLYHIFKGYDF